MMRHCGWLGLVANGLVGHVAEFSMRHLDWCVSGIAASLCDVCSTRHCAIQYCAVQALCTGNGGLCGVVPNLVVGHWCSRPVKALRVIWASTLRAAISQSRCC